MARLRTIVIGAVVVLVVTDVTWDGTSLCISVGWPGRKPIGSFVFPTPAPDPASASSVDQR
jgi:hypothetical protein